METKAKCLWRLVKAIDPRSTFLMTATCVGNWSVKVRHVCWSHAPTSRTSQKLAGWRTWSLGVSQCQGQHRDQPQPEQQAISPHLQTVTAANFSIHYRDSQEQDLKMTSSWRGKFKFSRKWCHNTIQSVGFLNSDNDTIMSMSRYTTFREVAYPCNLIDQSGYLSFHTFRISQLRIFAEWAFHQDKTGTPSTTSLNSSLW